MENIDKIFSEKLKSQKLSAPTDIWDNIEAELDRSGSTKSLLIWRIAASIAVLAGLSTLLLWEFVPDNSLYNLAQEMQIEEGTQPEVSSEQTSEPSIKLDLSDVNKIEEAKAVNLIASATENNKTQSELKKKEPLDTDAIEGKRIVGSKATNDDILQSLETSQPELIASNNFKNELRLTHSNQNQPELEVGNDKKEKQTMKDLLQKIEVGGNFSPTFAYRDVNSSGEGLPTELYNEYESGMVAFSGGLSIAMEVTKRLKVYSGLNYSQYGQQISGLNLYSNAAIDAYPEIYSNFSNSYQLNNSFGMTNIQSQYFFTDETKYRVDVASSNKLFFDEENESFYSVDGVLQQKLAYLEVPFVLDYLILDKGLQLSLQAGIGANFLVSDQLLLKTNETAENIGSTQDLARNNFSGILGLRISYPITPAFDLSLQPGVKYFINEINPASSIQTHPYTMGLYAGINYRF